jgi:hypothetical protein
MDGVEITDDKHRGEAIAKPDLALGKRGKPSRLQTPRPPVARDRQGLRPLHRLPEKMRA